MGSCISKCKPKKKSKQDFNCHVQDKLVISLGPIPSIPPKTTKTPSENPKHLSPPPSSSSTASFSSFSCSTNTVKCNTTSSSASSSSSSSSSYSSSSLLTAKDRSFSNEFLRSCAKDNPHVITRNPKAASVEKDQEIKKPFVGVNKIQYYYPQDLDPFASPLVKTNQPVREKATTNNLPVHKKRSRANSPTLVRQKSFRKEQSFNPMPNRALRSPSPGRRFSNGDNGRYVPRDVSSKGNMNAVDSCPKREGFRAPGASPNRETTTGRSYSTARRKDALISHQQVSAKSDGDHGGDVKEREEMDIVMEDVNNPHIALDCFIFL